MAPRDLYYTVAHKIHYTEDIKGCAVFISNRDMIPERFWLSTSNHFPDYIQWVTVRLIKIRSVHLKTNFTSRYHRCLFVFFDKNVFNDDMTSRCSKAPGHCSECPGNPDYVITKTFYEKEPEMEDDFIDRKY